MKYIIFLVLILTSSCSKHDMRVIGLGHTCHYRYCPYDRSDIIFEKGCGDCYQGEDCWRLDSLHFYNPRLNYDQCDSLLNTVK